MKIVLELDEDQAEMLSSIIDGHEDCGPRNEGWQSAELSELSAYIQAEIERQKGAK